MDSKVIFLDIDGTLTEPGSNTPPDSALKAIRAAQENGHYVFLCSGRSYGMLSPLLTYPFDGAIASSGGYIFCGDEVIFNHPLSEDMRMNLMEQLKENGIFRTIETKDGAYTDDSLKEYLVQHADTGSNSELLRWRKQLESSLNIRSMNEYEGQPAYKVVIMFEHMSQLEKVERALGDAFHYVVQPADDYGFINGEILTSAHDKGTGVKMVCDYLGIPLEDSIGFGDSMNDLEMMEMAGLSICMENGAEDLKAISDEICPSVQDDGIYEAFRKHGLI